MGHGGVRSVATNHAIAARPGAITARVSALSAAKAWLIAIPRLRFALSRTRTLTRSFINHHRKDFQMLNRPSQLPRPAPNPRKSREQLRPVRAKQVRFDRRSKSQPWAVQSQLLPLQSRIHGTNSMRPGTAPTIAFPLPGASGPIGDGGAARVV